MSGVKRTTTTITTSELNRLRAQASRTVGVEAQNAILNSQNAALIQANADFERRLTVLQTHNQNNQRTIEGMRTEIRNAVQQAVKAGEAAVRAAKEEARQAVQQAVKAKDEAIRAAKEESRRTQTQIDRLAADTARAIDQSNQRMANSLRSAEARLSQRIQQQNRRIDGLQQSLDQIAAGNAALAEQAEDLFAAAGAIARNAQDFAHGAAMIGGMKPVEDSLRRAQEAIDLTAKLPVNASVARQTAADAFGQAQDFYQRAAVAEEVWNLRELAARQSIAAASARLDSSRTLCIEEEDEDGKPVRVEVDVDHWSDGELTALRERLGKLDGELENAQTISDLDGVCAAADRISAETVDAAASASIAAHESQNRSATADDFADALSDHGMTLVDHGFAGGDKRGVHRIHMRDAVTGDEVIITQIPTRNADGSITTSVEADLISDTLSGEMFERRGNDMYFTLGLCADDCHSQTEVQTLPGYEQRPSDRRGVTIGRTQTVDERNPSRRDGQSKPA